MTDTHTSTHAATHTGACFCGAVEIEARGTPLEMGYCHCGFCRSFSGAPVTAFTLWKAEQVRVTKGAELIGRFDKTGMTVRCHCTRCGGHLMGEHPGMGCTDVPAGKLPTLSFRPQLHLNYAATVFPMKDGLPKLRDFPKHAGGSGEEMAE